MIPGWSEYKIRRDEIPKLMNDPVIFDQINAYRDYQVFGWHYGQSWASDAPAVLVDVIRALKQEDAAIAEEQERMRRGEGTDDGP